MGRAILGTIWRLCSNSRSVLARARSMVELAVIIGSLSAGIFLAHAIEAYHGQ